jgi:hypothetical protein
MTAKKVIMAIAFVLVASSAASAQSAYTTGTIASSEAAGYPAPAGYGSGLYAYAPGYAHAHVGHNHRR